MKTKIIIFLIIMTFLLTACKNNSNPSYDISNTINEDADNDESIETDESILTEDTTIDVEDMLPSDDNIPKDDNSTIEDNQASVDNTVSDDDSASNDANDVNDANENEDTQNESTPIKDTPSKDAPSKDTPNKVTPSPAISYLKELKAYKFEIDGVSYQLPIKMGDLTSKGWKLITQSGTDFKTDVLLAPLGEVYAVLKKGKEYLYITMINQMIHESNKYNEFLIYHIEGNIKLPGGISINSSVSDVKKKYGKIINSNGADDYWSLLQYINPVHKYSADNHLIIDGIEMYAEKGKVSTVSMQHFNINLLDMVAKIDQPYQYDTPSQLGKNMFNYTFGLKDHFYELPAPLSAFLDQGFIVSGIIADELFGNEQVALNNLGKKGVVLAPGETIPLILKKKNKVIAVQLKNEYGSFQYYKDCTIVNVRMLPFNTGATCTIAGNIQIGSSEEELIASFGDMSYARYSNQQLEAHLNIMTYSTYDNWVRYEVYEQNENNETKDKMIPYTGKVSYDIVNGIVKEINFTRLNNGNLGYINEDDLILATDDPKDKYNYSKEEMIDFLSYDDENETSNWSENNYVMLFNKSGYFSAYDAGAGNPWLLLYGDTVEGNASYTIDAEKHLILVEDYKRTIKIHYTILSSFEIKMTLEESNISYYFYKR